MTQKKEYTLPEDSGYRIVRRLGSGGEGMVYLVCHLSTEQLRAAKVLTNIREDRKHELDMMKHLHHPSLPQIMDVLEQDGYLWLIMEYIQGCRLDQSVSRGMSQDQLWSVASQLSCVLVYLHTRKEPVLHLDIKPSNILVRPNQTIVLIDFGASIRGHPQDENVGKYGTRGFAAPEQQQREGTIDARTDIYGVGAVLYYCCYGRAPIMGKNSSFSIGLRFWHRGLSQVIKKCLEKNPGKRYEDSCQLYTAICRAQRAELFCRKMGKTVAAMTLFLPATMLLIYSLSDSGRSDGTIYQGEVFAQEPALVYDAEPIVTDGIEETMEDASENVSENDIEGSLQNQRNLSNESEIESELTNETDMNETGTAETVLAVKEQEYRRLLNMAGGMGLSQAVECYKQASELYPGDGEWYMQLLEQVTADGLFETEEENAVKELIYAAQPDSGDTAIERLAGDASAYGLFTYRMGLAYWYYYDGTGGKSAAAWWFRLAIDSQGDEPYADWFESAVILSRIGSYYGMLGSTNVEEEREAKEWDYWNDLKELWYLYQEQEEESEIRAQTAEELLSMIILKSGVLRDYGASWEETTEILAAIEIFSEGESMADDQKEREKLEEQSAAAKSALERAYQESFLY